MWGRPTVPRGVKKMAELFAVGDCVRIPDGRIGRVREVAGRRYGLRFRRQTSKTHQFVLFAPEDLERVDCPKGWMSPEGYARYTEATLARMKEREAAKRRGRRDWP